MRYALLVVLIGARFCAAAGLPPRPASEELQAAAAAPSEGYEAAASQGSTWSDGAFGVGDPASPPVAAASSDDDGPLTVGSYLREKPSESVFPPSPARDAKDEDGFMKGMAFVFTAVEWPADLIANAVPLVGKPLGGGLGMLLAPIGIVAGALAGAALWVAGLF